MITKVQLGFFLACILAVYAAERQALEIENLELDEKNSKPAHPEGCMVTNPEARDRSVCTRPAAAYGSRAAQAAKAEASKRASGEARYTQTTPTGECDRVNIGIIRWIRYCREHHCTWAYVLPNVHTYDCARPNERCCKWLQQDCRCITRRVSRYVRLVMPWWWGHHGGICLWPGWCIRRVRITYKGGCRCSCYCRLPPQYGPRAPDHSGK